MSVSLYKNVLIYNGLGMADEEVKNYSEAVLNAGVPLTVDPLGITFRKSGDFVLGGPSRLSPTELEALAVSVLMEYRPYPEWLVEMFKDVDFSGLHTLIIAAGSDRFALREELSRYSKLILNTGEEDVYITRGVFRLELNADRVFMATGEDMMENARKVFALKLHTNGIGVKRYENLEREDFHNFGKSRDILNLDARIGLDFVVKALEVFHDELVDMRIPKELCWLMRGLGG